jgi:tellurite resistance protein
MERLIGSVIRGALGGKRKRSRGAARFLTGGRSSFLNASTLMTLAGVAWGVIETATQSSGTPGAGAPPATGTPRPPAGPTVVPPPLPGAATRGPEGLPTRTSAEGQPPAAGPLTPPPLPHTAGGPAGPPPPRMPVPAGAGFDDPSASAAASPPAVPPEVLRVIRLTLSAARADGVLGAHEREAILAQARSVGAEAIIAAELDAPAPLAEIATGIADPRAREDLYTLAFTIVRADEQVQPDERRYLEELARHLELDASAVERLEQQAAARIAAASQGDNA